MKKKFSSITGILLLIIILSVVALFIGRANSTHANDQLGREPVILLDVIDRLEDTGQLYSLVSDTGEPGVILAQEVQELSSRWHENNRKSGWIHIVSVYQVDQDEIRVFPDGKPMENGYVQEQWFLLDEHGYEITHVSIQRDMNGNVIQVSALRDGTGYNLTYGIKMSLPDEALEFVWDFGFPGMAADFVGSLEKEMISLDDQTVVLYTLTEEFPFPMDFSGFTDPVVAIKTQACYEPESGKLLSLERVVIFSSGEERVTDTMELVSWERGVRPPAEVQKYLDATYEDDFIDPSEMIN